MEYEVVRRLARGGMGVVDLARRPDGSLVALKRLGLHGTAAEMQLARARFQRELDTLSRIDHDAIVPLLDVVDDAGDVVLVMPYLAGGSLADQVREHGPMPTDGVLAVARRLLPALATAHRAGIVHRDIKPANVLFDDQGRAHLADFGVATSGEVTDGLTRTGVVLGTPGYLSPEQARGEPATPASDIASLGATLHFAATGASPYGGGEAPAVLLRTARAKASIDRSIDPALRRMLRAMLRGRPDRRPSAAALAGGAADTDPIPRMARRKRTGLAVGALVAAVVVAGGVWAATHRDDDPAAAPAVASTTTAATTTTRACIPLRYQPCGGVPAPHTDGLQCIDDHADYDEVRANGCEAAPDDVDGTPLTDRISANLVPALDVDHYPLHVNDAGDLGCNNTLRLTITAPAGTAIRLELRDDGGELVGETTSADGVPGEIAVHDPALLPGRQWGLRGDRVVERQRPERRGLRAHPLGELLTATAGITPPADGGAGRAPPAPRRARGAGPRPGSPRGPGTQTGSPWRRRPRPRWARSRCRARSIAPWRRRRAGPRCCACRAGRRLGSGGARVRCRTRSRGASRR